MTKQQTNDSYWDCECRDLYIHPKSQFMCGRCGALQEDCPDSLNDEVIALGLPEYVDDEENDNEEDEEE